MDSRHDTLALHPQQTMCGLGTRISPRHVRNPDCPAPFLSRHITHTAYRRIVDVCTSGPVCGTWLASCTLNPVASIETILMQ